MSNLHIVCPHCHSTNRVANDRISSSPQCGKCKRGLFTGQPVALTAANFNQHIIKSDISVVVDFWAPWCGPCKMMAPVFEQAACQLEPQFRLAKVDTEAEQQLAQHYNIRSIPTLAVFQHGKELKRQPGAMDLNSIISWVKQ